MDLKKGDEVWILDYPFGKPLDIKGVVVGTVGSEHYNILIKNGLMEGDIKKYKYWSLFLVDGEEEIVL
mgnify:CR=1 FL=1|jgi:hypothetical protein|tara:strand:- start:933 stop:1136 length:204 start_codon:yes stop_codon:yes gene_type:complete